MGTIDSAVSDFIGTVGRMATIRYWAAGGEIITSTGWVRMVSGNRVSLTVKRSRTSARTVYLNVFDIVSI